MIQDNVAVAMLEDRESAFRKCALMEMDSKASNLLLDYADAMKRGAECVNIVHSGHIVGEFHRVSMDLSDGIMIDVCSECQKELQPYETPDISFCPWCGREQGKYV